MFLNIKQSRYKDFLNIFWAFEVPVILIIYGFLLYRVRYGIDFTDESWYVAEPYVVANGAIPFVNQWTQAPGFSIPLSVISLLYVKICGSTEGIVLFFRLFYLVWLFINGILAYMLLRKKEKQIPVIAILIPTTTLCYSLFEVNYNSIGLVYLLIAVLILFYERNRNDAVFIQGLISGLITGRSVIGTPCILFSTTVIIIALLFMKQYKRMAAFMIGGGLSASAFFVYAVVKSGSLKKLHGITYLFRDLVYFKIPGYSSALNNIKYAVSFLYPCFVFVILVLIARIFLEIRNKYEFFADAVLIFTIIYFMIGILQNEIERWMWFQSIPVFLFATSEQRRRIVAPFVVTITYFTAYFFVSWSNIYGFGNREYWLRIPICMSMFAIYFLYSKTYAIRRVYLCMCAGIILLVTVCVTDTYKYVYRDDDLSSLETTVQSGIWKGCVTTEIRAENVVELEKYIGQITEDITDVLFLDWASFGYLMTNAKICAPSTLDSLCYTYNTNYPEIMYDYFDLEQNVPDTIIFIDFGRDKFLSIQNNDWKFNDFINRFYLNSSSSYENESFKVFQYDLQDETGALEYAESHKSINESNGEN